MPFPKRPTSIVAIDTPNASSLTPFRQLVEPWNKL